MFCGLLVEKHCCRIYALAYVVVDFWIRSKVFECLWIFLLATVMPPPPWVGIKHWSMTQNHVAIGCDLKLFRKRNFRNGRQPDIVLLENKDCVPKGSGHLVGKARLPSGKRTVMNHLPTNPDLILNLKCRHSAFGNGLWCGWHIGGAVGWVFVVLRLNS